jgi:hypothetical protein
MDDHQVLPQPINRRLAIAAVMTASFAATGCEPRPRDPKPPKDPGRNVPKPSPAAGMQAGVASPALPKAR